MMVLFFYKRFPWVAQTPVVPCYSEKHPYSVDGQDPLRNPPGGAFFWYPAMAMDSWIYRELGPPARCPFSPVSSLGEGSNLLK